MLKNDYTQIYHVMGGNFCFSSCWYGDRLVGRVGDFGRHDRNQSHFSRDRNGNAGAIQRLSRCAGSGSKKRQGQRSSEAAGECQHCNGERVDCCHDRIRCAPNRSRNSFDSVKLVDW